VFYQATDHFRKTQPLHYRVDIQQRLHTSASSIIQLDWTHIRQGQDNLSDDLKVRQHHLLGKLQLQNEEKLEQYLVEISQISTKVCTDLIPSEPLQKQAVTQQLLNGCHHPTCGVPAIKRCSNTTGSYLIAAAAVVETLAACP